MIHFSLSMNCMKHELAQLFCSHRLLGDREVIWAVHFCCSCPFGKFWCNRSIIHSETKYCRRGSMYPKQLKYWEGKYSKLPRKLNHNLSTPTRNSRLTAHSISVKMTMSHSFVHQSQSGKSQNNCTSLWLCSPLSRNLSRKTRINVLLFLSGPKKLFHLVTLRKCIFCFLWDAC